jgi:tRNA (adenine22-N1)-methyltransferase
MKLPLSPRLRACCNFIIPGSRVADVGTDHGYLGIWLLLEGVARSVIASDVVPGPLSAAQRNAQKYGVADRMEFCLSDGVTAVPRDFDCLVCAGMGADTIISILSAAPWLRSSAYRLVLQCQSKTPMLRRYLSDTGWRITEESAVRDGKFIYTAMEVLWQPGYHLTPGEWFFPPALLENPAECVPEYFQRTVNTLRKIVMGRGEHAEPELVQALTQLDKLAKDPNLNFLTEVNYDDCE